MDINTAEKIANLIKEREKYKSADLLNKAEFCRISFNEGISGKTYDYYITKNKELCNKIIQIMEDEKYLKLKEIDKQIENIII